MSLPELRWDDAGLIPAVAQEAQTGEVLMVAWMNREALQATLASGLAHYWSRSRQALWRKGETSGHAQHVEAVYADCDGDTLLLLVHQAGPACHTGARTCFFTRLAPAGPDAPAPGGTGPGILEAVERVIQSRRVARPAGSYVVRLLDAGQPEICRKIGEEATEVITAALAGEGDRRVVEEVADLWFHTLVLLGERGIALREVLDELARRHAPRPAPR